MSQEALQVKWSTADLSCEAVARRGVSLAFLHDFHSAFVAPRADAERVTMHGVVTEMAAYAQRRGTSLFLSLFPAAAGAPAAFICTVWNTPFAALLRALDAHYGGADPAATHVWLCGFACAFSLENGSLRQVRDTSLPEPLRLLGPTRAAIKAAGCTLVVLDRQAVALGRAWCLLEMGLTPPGALHFLTPEPLTSDDLLEAFSRVPDTWDDIGCLHASHKAAIMAAVEAQAGSLSAFRDSLRLRLLLSPSAQRALLGLVEKAADAAPESVAASSAACAGAVCAEAAAAPVAAPAAACAPAALPATCDGPGAQVMLSYRVTESGEGGDGWSLRLAHALRCRGFTVFLAETSLDAGCSWADVIADAVRRCQVFVPVCSETYADRDVSKWTSRELHRADSLDKQIVPVWHSHAYPPDKAAMFLGGLQRVPSGAQDARALPLEEVVTQLERAFARLSQPSLPAIAAGRDADAGAQ